MLRTLHLRLFAVLIILQFLAAAAVSQTTDDDDVQQWNEITISKPLSKKVDLVFPFTIRFTKDISRFNEGRAGVGLAFHPHERVTVNGIYQYIRARGSSGDFAPEHRYSAALSYKFPVKSFGLSHRSQIEYRHRSAGNTWRYRPSVTVEKKLPASWIKDGRVYVTEEPFYDSGAGRFSRNRLSFGFGKGLTSNASVDIYYLRQDDRNSTTRLTHVIGTSWKIKLP